MSEVKVDGKGERKNEGKLPLDLVPISAQLSLARVLSVGARKYSPNNWRKGMSWNIVISCIERHLAAFKAGEDHDQESGLRHIEHILCNVAFLNEYFYTCPHLDDRFTNTEAEIALMFDRKVP